jgi:hypothetical protein
MDEMNNITNAEQATEQVVASEEVVDAALTEETEVKYEAEDSLSGLTEAQRKRKEIFDKITTGILILLLASPIAILTYIFLWFILR